MVQLKFNLDFWFVRYNIFYLVGTVEPCTLHFFFPREAISATSANHHEFILHQLAQNNFWS
jgi:hypothetical protein